MRVFFPAVAAAFAASVMSTDVSAKAVPDLPSAEELAAEIRIEVEMAKRRDINNTATAKLCEQMTILSGVESVLVADWPVNGGASLYPKAFNFAESTVTFPPYDPASEKPPEVIIQWPDLVELDEYGEEVVMEGKEQTIVLEDQSLTDVPYFTKGFTGDAITEDISNKLECFADAIKENGVMTRSVTCTDYLGQMSILTFGGEQATLSHFFDIMTSPATPLRLGCVWPVDLRRIETAPNGP